MCLSITEEYWLPVDMCQLNSIQDRLHTRDASEAGFGNQNVIRGLASRSDLHPNARNLSSSNARSAS